jgi:hypothetical protein
MDFVGWENVERRHLYLTAARSLGTSAIVLLVYFVVPIANHPHNRILVRLTAGLVLFGVALVYEVRAILRSPRPMLRAANAMALIIPVFVVVFSWIYLTIARSSPAAFTQHLDRVAALYFTVTVFATVGFGDIAPVSQAARLTVTTQMVCDVIVIAVVIRLILEAARGRFGGTGASS